MLVKGRLGTRLLALSLACLLSACAGAAEPEHPDVGGHREALVTVVQQVTTSTILSNVITASWSVAPTAGNLLVAIQSQQGGAVSAITHPTGWSVAIDNQGSTPGETVYYKVATAAESSVTVTFPVLNLVHSLRLLEFSGYDGKNAPAVSTKTGSSTQNVALTAVATTGPSGLVIASASNVATLGSAPVASWSNSFTGLTLINPSLTATSATAAYLDATSAGSYTTTMTLDKNANVSADLIAFNRLPQPVTNFSVTAGASQTYVTFSTPPLPVTHVLIQAKTLDCNFTTTPTGTEARGTVVGGGTVIFNDSPNANLSSTSVTVDGVSTSVSYTSSNNAIRHQSLTANTLYCYRIFVRNNLALDTQSASPKTRSVTPFSAAITTAPRFIVSSGATSLSPASIIPSLGAFYGDNSGKVMTIADPGIPSFASAQLPDAVSSRSAAGILTSETDTTGYLGGLDGDAYAVYLSGSAVGTLRWSSVAIDGDSSTVGDQALGTAVYAAPLVSRPLSRVFVATRNAASAQNRIFALNAATGACVWVLNGTCAGATTTLNVGQISAAPLLDSTNYRLLFTNALLNSGSTVWSIDAHDSVSGSRVLWSRNLGSSDSALAYADVNRVAIFVGTNAGRLYKLVASSGVTCWGSSGDGCVGTASGTEQFFCTDTTVNARATGCANGSAIQKTIVPVNGAFLGNVVFSTADGNVRMVNGQGTQVWRTMIAGASPPVPVTDLSPPKVYVGGSDGLVHELTLATGVETASRSVGGGSVVAGAPAYDGFASPTLLHLNTSQGYQYAFTLPF